MREFVEIIKTWVFSWYSIKITSKEDLKTKAEATKRGLEILICALRTGAYRENPALYWQLCEEYTSEICKWYPKNLALKLFCGILMTYSKSLAVGGIEEDSYKQSKAAIIEALITLTCERLRDTQQMGILKTSSSVLQAMKDHKWEDFFQDDTRFLDIKKALENYVKSKRMMQIKRT